MKSIILSLVIMMSIASMAYASDSSILKASTQYVLQEQHVCSAGYVLIQSTHEPVCHKTEYRWADASVAGVRG